jgi:hypothetical protein
VYVGRVFGVSGTASAREPVVLSIGRNFNVWDTITLEASHVSLTHFWFDDRFQTGTSKGHVGRVRVHLAVRKVCTLYVSIHEVVVELEHV